jgi:hypothetical protein
MHIGSPCPKCNQQTQEILEISPEETLVEVQCSICGLHRHLSFIGEKVFNSRGEEMKDKPPN